MIIKLTILLCFLCTVSYGQGVRVPFGGTRPIDTSYAGRVVLSDSGVVTGKVGSMGATPLVLKVNGLTADSIATNRTNYFQTIDVNGVSMFHNIVNLASNGWTTGSGALGAMNFGAGIQLTRFTSGPDTAQTLSIENLNTSATGDILQLRRPVGSSHDTVYTYDYKGIPHQKYFNTDGTTADSIPVMHKEADGRYTPTLLPYPSSGGVATPPLDSVLKAGDTSSRNIVLKNTGSLVFPNTKYPGSYTPQGLFYGSTTYPTFWISEDSLFGKNKFHNYFIGQGTGNPTITGGAANIAIGDSSMLGLNGFGNISIGGHNFMSTSTPVSVQQNTVLGFGSFALEGGYAGTTGNQGAYNTILGAGIAPTASNPYLNILGGAFSCTALTTGAENAVYGAQSFTSAKYVNGASIFGYGNSPAFNDTTGNSFSSLCSIGYDGSFRLKRGIEDIFIGGKSVNFDTSGSDNVCIGNLVASDADNIDQSTIIGANSGMTTENVDPHKTFRNRIMLGYRSYAVRDSMGVIGSKLGDLKAFGIGWKDTLPTAQFEIKCNPNVDTMLSIKDSLGREIAYGTYSGKWVLNVKGNTVVANDSAMVIASDGTIKRYAIIADTGLIISGNINPLATAVVSNTTTGHTITLATSTAAANTVLGNHTGSTAVPTYGQVVTGDVAAAAITYAKMQNITSGKLLGSISASNVAPGEVTVSTGLNLSTAGVLTSLGVVSNAKNYLAAQTAAVSSVATLTPAADGNYWVGGSLNITAVSVDIIQFQCTYTDENNTAQTITFANQGTTNASFTVVGNSSIPTVQIRAKASTAITIKTVLTTGTGSITYDVAGNITALP